jgi:heat shock protein HslJ
MIRLAALTIIALGMAACARDSAPDPQPAPTAAAPVPAEPATPVADGAHDSRNSLDWAGTYHGVLPCADCPGIETIVTLRQQGTFQSRSTYLEREGPVRQQQGRFTWSEDGGTVMLEGDPPARYRVGENRLIALALDGSPVTGTLADKYVLEKLPPGLLGRPWRLVELRGQPVATLEREPYLFLETRDNRVTGFGGCNGFTGAFTLDEATMRLRFDKVASTMMACDKGMDVEQALHEVLNMTDNFSLAEGQLSLNRARMAPLARFRAD